MDENDRGLERAPAAEKSGIEATPSVGSLLSWLRRVGASGAASSALVVAGVTVFVLWQLHPSLLLSPSMDVGGDNAAHVAAMYYFIHHLLPHGQLSGWDPQWFGGFPLYVFYFPLPALLAAFFNLFTSYAVAFKLVSVTGLVLTPVAAWSFGVLAGFRRPIPALMCVAMLPYLLNTSYTIDGGNIVSTMAGEFSFSLSLVFALFFLGVFSYALRTGRLRALAALLYGASVLSHVVPALFAAGVATLLALAQLRRGPGRGPQGGRIWGWLAQRLAVLGRVPQPLVILASVGVIGGALAAVWLVPFGADLRYSASMGYQRVTGFSANFLPGPIDDLMVALGACGLGLSIWRRSREVLVLGIAAGLELLAFFFLPDGLVYNARWLPFWFLTVDLLAAYALGEGARLLCVRARRVDLAGALGPLLVGAVALVVSAAYCGVLLGYSGTVLDEAPAWARFNYTGYQGMPGWGEFSSLVSMLERAAKVHGCGRLDYEYSPNTTDTYGSTLVPMSFPMWTNGCIQTEEGVYYESSIAIYYHFLDQSELSVSPSNPVAGLPYQGLNVADGIRHLQLEGVKYFLADSPTVEQQAAADPALVRIGSSPEASAVVDAAPGTVWPPGARFSYVLYEIKDAPIVTALRRRPVVEQLSQLAWRATAVDWFQSEADWPVEIASSGPRSWRRLPGGALAAPRTQPKLPTARVSHLVMGNASVAFDVNRVGVPVLVRVPYFPAWSARGATGPYEATPGFMVVVPYTHHVVLTYGLTPADWLGRAGTLAGLVGLGLLVRPLPIPAGPSTMPDDGVPETTDDAT